MVTNPKPENRQWVAQYTREQTARGLKRVSVWVPESDVERLKLIAMTLRVEAGIRLPTDGETKPPEVVMPDVRSVQRDSKNCEMVYLRLGRHEVALHKLLTANGGRWRARLRRWHVRADVAHRLGLGGRIAAPSDDPELEAEQDNQTLDELCHQRELTEVQARRIRELEDRVAVLQKVARRGPGTGFGKTRQ